MRYCDSIFGRLLEPISRRRFAAIVERHEGDAYDKSFKSWDHLVALVFAQLSHTDTLRGLELAFNANAGHHYHLGVGKLARTTLSDANKRRPLGVFADTFALLSQEADRVTRQEAAEMVRLIDASPIPLGSVPTGTVPRTLLVVASSTATLLAVVWTTATRCVVGSTTTAPRPAATSSRTRWVMSVDLPLPVAPMTWRW